jgi:Ca-activated chloride channel homolog
MKNEAMVMDGRSGAGYRFSWIVLLLLALTLALSADGFIVIPHPPRPLPLFPLEVTRHQVEVRIAGGVATTTVDQEFYNPNNLRLEGTYLFPLPDGAAIRRFSMWINGAETPAELLDAAKARSIYEDIVRRLRDPALLEYDGRGVFKARIFPIEPREKKRVKISYSELLTQDNRTCEYLYPLGTEKFSAAPLQEVSVRVEIDSREKLGNIYSPSHPVEIVRHGAGRATVGFEARDMKPETDFRLYFDTAPTGLGFSLLSCRKSGQDGYFLLNVTPAFDANEPAVPRDIVCVLDTSGSMAGESLKRARQALLFFVENLTPGDRFDIVRFATEAEPLFCRLTPVGEEARRQARRFLDNLQAIGGTNMQEALTLALGERGADSRPFTVVFVTDGKPTVGETDEDQLLQVLGRANPGRARVFTFGIGEEINTHLLDRITERTRGSRSYVAPNQEIEVRLSDFFRRVQSPVLTDLQLDFGSTVRVEKLYPRDMPDLFRGSALTVLGRYRGDGPVTVRLSGMAGARKRDFSFSGELVCDDERLDFVPPLWAARRVGFLLDEIRLRGESRELVDEITALAREHGIVTPYTSYLIVEEERRRLERGDIRSDDQTLNRLAAAEPEFQRLNTAEYDAMKATVGAGSVRASKKLQEMNAAVNAPQPGIRSGAGNGGASTAQQRQVQGRAFYNFRNQWVDARMQNQKNGAVQRVRFASGEYFDLLRRNPELAAVLALGNNIRFVHRNQAYEVFDS